jgi:hypothetical protein
MWTTLISDQSTAVQQVVQSAVLPIQVSEDTTTFDTPVQLSQIQFPDDTIQSAAWTASHAAEFDRISNIPQVSEVPPLPGLAVLVEESGNMQMDVTYLSNGLSTITLDSDAYVQQVLDVSTSLSATLATQQSFTDDFSGVTALVDAKNAVQSVADTIPSRVATAATQWNELDVSIAAYSAVLPILETTADTAVSLSWISDQIQVDVSTTQFQSMHVEIDTTTNSAYSGISVVRKIPGDAKPTVLYMTPYSDNRSDYTTFLPSSFLLNHAICGQLGRAESANSFALTKSLAMTNPAGTRGIRLPMLEGDTTTRTELWSDLTISGGSMNMSACSVAGNTTIPQGFGLNWDLVPAVKSASVVNNTCTLNWEEGPIWALSGVDTGNFGIQVQNFPSDTTKQYTLRLLYDSSGGYGNTMTAASFVNQSMFTSADLTTGFIQQWIQFYWTGTAYSIVSDIQTSSVIRPLIWTYVNPSNDATVGSIIDMAYGNGLYVAIRNNVVDNILYGTDCVNWTVYTMDPARWTRKIVFANNIFMICSDTGIIRIPWSTTTTEFTPTYVNVAFWRNQYIQGVTFISGATWIATKQSKTTNGGILIKSADNGLTWTQDPEDTGIKISSSTTLTGSFTDILYANGAYFLSRSVTPYLVRLQSAPSTTSTWTSITINNGSKAVTKLRYVNSKVLCISSSSITEMLNATTTTTINLGFSNLVDIAYRAPYYLAVTSIPTTWISQDLTNWTQVSIPSIPSSFNLTFCTVGHDGRFVTNNLLQKK